MKKNKKKQLKKVSGIILTGAIGVSLLTGCGDSSSGNVSGNTSGEGAVTTEEDGVTVTYAGSQPVETLDRFNQYDTADFSLGLLWGDALVEADHRGNYEPWLAENIELSDDNLSATFTLKKGVKFQNGGEFTSYDVKRTFERFLENTDLILGTKWSNYVDHVETPDDYTAVLYFSQPMPTFYFELSLLPVIDGETYDENSEDYFKIPVGTGPFEVTAYDNTTQVVRFSRNDDWWGWTDENKSNVDTIIYQHVSEDTTRVSSLRAGELEIADMIPLDNTEILEEEGFIADTYDSNMFAFMGVNCADGRVFADKDLREALSLCIDRQLIVDSILGGGVAATWPSFENHGTYESGKGYKYNLEEAQQLVESSGYDGSELTLLINSAKLARGTEVAQAIQSMATEAGFNVSIETLENATYNEKRDAGEYDMCLGSTTFTSGDSYIPAVEINARDTFNTGFHTDELTTLGEEAKQLVNNEERMENAKQIFEIVMNEFAPNIYLYQVENCIATVAGISNITVFGDNVVDLRYVTLDDTSES